MERATNILLFVVIILLLAVLVDKSGFPKTASAQAANRETLLISGADNSDIFFMINTEKQLICCYDYKGNGPKGGIRLLGARKYDADLQIPTELVSKFAYGYTRKDIVDGLNKKGGSR